MKREEEGRTGDDVESEKEEGAEGGEEEHQG